MANVKLNHDANKEIDEWADYEEVKKTDERRDETNVNLLLEMNNNGIKTFHCDNCGCDDIKQYFVFCPVCGKKIKFYKAK